MSVRPQLAALTGQWKGSYRLHRSSQLSEKTHDSVSNAKIELRFKEQFLAIEYAWEYEGKRQEGVLILGCDEGSDAVQAIWTDSWHMSHKFIVCDGVIDDRGRVEVHGYYSVSDKQDWGWQTEIVAEPQRFQVSMFNVSPEGDKDMAVESIYTRI